MAIKHIIVNIGTKKARIINGVTGYTPPPGIGFPYWTIFKTDVQKAPIAIFLHWDNVKSFEVVEEPEKDEH